MSLDSSYLKCNMSQEESFAQIMTELEGAGITFRNFDLQYIKNFVVNAIIDLIATNVAEMKPVLDEKNGFWDIINYPNERQTFKQFIYEFVANKELNAVAYNYITTNDDGTISGIWNYKRKEVLPEINYRDNNISGWNLYLGGNNTRYIRNYYTQRYDKRNHMFMWRDYNSMSSYPYLLPAPRGEAGLGILEYINNLEIFNNKFFKNIKPGYVLYAESKNGYSQKLNDSQKEAIRKSFYNKNSEGRLLILEDGYKIELIGNDLDKMNFANSIKEYASLYCSLYRVPPEMLYIISASTGQYRAVEETRLDFYYSRIMPIMQEICDLFNKWYVYRYNPITAPRKYLLSFDKTQIAVVEKDRYNIAKLRTETGSLTLDELREPLGKDTVKYGDRVYMSKNYTDLENIIMGDQNAGTNNNNQKQLSKN